jgi:hypothetical protein
MHIAIWHMGTTGTIYDDPGADYYTRLNPDAPEPEPSNNSKPWATASPSTTRPERLRRKTTVVNLRIEACSDIGAGDENRTRTVSLGIRAACCSGNCQVRDLAPVG